MNARRALLVLTLAALGAYAAFSLRGTPRQVPSGTPTWVPGTSDDGLFVRLGRTTPLVFQTVHWSDHTEPVKTLVEIRHRERADPNVPFPEPEHWRYSTSFDVVSVDVNALNDYTVLGQTRDGDMVLERWIVGGGPIHGPGGSEPAPQEWGVDIKQPAVQRNELLRGDFGQVLSVATYPGGAWTYVLALDSVLDQTVLWSFDTQGETAQHPSQLLTSVEVPALRGFNVLAVEISDAGYPVLTVGTIGSLVMPDGTKRYVSERIVLEDLKLDGTYDTLRAFETANAKYEHYGDSLTGKSTAGVQ